MVVLHVNWAEGALRLWAESLSAYAGVASDHTTSGVPWRADEAEPIAADRSGSSSPNSAIAHPFALSSDELESALVTAGLLERNVFDEARTIRFDLPCDRTGPRPSDRLASAVGVVERRTELRLGAVEIPTVGLRNDQALSAVLRLEDRGPTEGIEFGSALRYWIAVARFVLELLADQRFIPTLIQPQWNRGALQAGWHPWMHDESAQTRLTALLTAMPPVVRAVGNGYAGQPWRILHDAIEALSDATVRRALIEEGFLEAIQGRDASSDAQVSWCQGLLGEDDTVVPVGGDAADMLREVQAWIGRLEEADRGEPFRLCLRLDEPPGEESSAALEPIAACWRLSLHLLMEGQPPVIVDARRVWASSPAAQVVEGQRIDRPQELLLAELGRASRVYPKIDSALFESQPSGIDLTTAEAVRFLREFRPLLEESGFGVIVPEWWDQPSCRLGVRLQIDAPASDVRAGGAGGSSSTAPSMLGLRSLVRYRWQIAIGDQSLSAEQLRRLVQRGSPLVRIGNRWVELSQQDIAKATAFVQSDPGGEVSLLEAMRMAQGIDKRTAGLSVLGMDATGWVADVFDGDHLEQRVAMGQVSQPRGFVGTLRPYQKAGLSWLAFLESFGLGACLADDMGLGKTIQLIALLLHERELHPHGPRVGPTLLVVPTSLIGNWTREMQRFAPALSWHVHHGPQRRIGEQFVECASTSDVVITTYALVPRDRDTLDRVSWRRVVLDEAQYIKNPPTKQATAIRGLPAERRVALTGTPVENRLSELWSILEFCNPGFLGHAEEFRRRFAVPVERHRDGRAADALRALVRPFVLRRLKADPKVIVDLPACVQTKEYATLTAEQATLYQAVVDDLLASVEQVDGIQRRGRVLATLTRLKQVCNHPTQLLQAVGDAMEPAAVDVDHRQLSSRSGKCKRLIEMLEELLAEGDTALVFTQFRRMGHLLTAMIRHDLDRDVLFMHGSIPQHKRQEMIDRFQRADGTAPIFILSLKAGGVGLNLTAANHVFHFDRWWNPAVENQATDRAFRIGQTRTVHVHKFVCVGTLEERIDQMIERKSELAENIIGTGEQWLTELSTQQLRDVLQLRVTAMEVGS